MKNSEISILVPESQLPAEGADIPSVSGNSSSSLLSVYSELLTDSALIFNVDAEGKVQFANPFVEEDFMTMRLSEGESATVVGMDGNSAPARIDLSSVAESVSGSIDAEDGMRRLVERLAEEMRQAVNGRGGNPIPLIRWQAAETAGEGGVAQLLGVWLASDEQLTDVRSDGGCSLILEEAEIEGRGLKETLAALAVLGVMAGGTVDAEAGLFRKVFKKKTEKSQQVSQNRQAPVRVDKDALSSTSASSTHVVVDVSRQRAYLISNGAVVVDTPVSTAREGKYTPRGTFKITQRVESGKKSTIYGCDLPYWMRLDQSAIGLHIGELPGYPASAGCVRLPAEIAPVLFNLTKSGTTVSIVDSWQPDLLVASN